MTARVISLRIFRLARRKRAELEDERIEMLNELRLYLTPQFPTFDWEADLQRAIDAQPCMYGKTTFSHTRTDIFFSALANALNRCSDRQEIVGFVSPNGV